MLAGAGERGRHEKPVWQTLLCQAQITVVDKSSNNDNIGRLWQLKTHLLQNDVLVEHTATTGGAGLRDVDNGPSADQGEGDASSSEDGAEGTAEPGVADDEAKGAGGGAQPGEESGATTGPREQEAGAPPTGRLFSSGRDKSAAGEPILLRNRREASTVSRNKVHAFDRGTVPLYSAPPPPLLG